MSALAPTCMRQVMVMRSSLLSVLLSQTKESKPLSLNCNYQGSKIVADPWIYGADGVEDDERLWQVFMYMRDPTNATEADSNHYALPLSISPVVDPVTMKVIRIDYLPTGKDNTTREPGPWKPQPAN